MENRGDPEDSLDDLKKSTWGHGGSYDEGENHPARRSEITKWQVSYRRIYRKKEWVFVERINKNIPEASGAATIR